jgi:DHA1 family multidrug resistance protein-like MFS transporter
VRSVFLAESAFYAVVPPLVPVFVAQTHMTTSQIGFLVAAYPAGILIAAIPAIALAARRGVRATTMIGLSLLVMATLAFAWSPSPLLLDAARLTQGIGGAVAWAGALAWLTSTSSPARRAAVIGGSVGVALIGMVIGPPIGAVASQAGRGFVFSLIAAVLALMVLVTPQAAEPVAPTAGSLRALSALFRNRNAILGGALLGVIGVVNGTLATLVPLLLSGQHGSSAVIASVFVSSYLLAAVWNVLLGRLADRIGRLIPVIGGLIIAAVLLAFLPSLGALLPLTVGAVIAGSAASGLWSPTAAMVTDAAASAASSQAVAVATMNAAWAAGGTAGAIGVAAIADAAGLQLPFSLVGALCALAALASVLSYRRNRAVTATCTTG